ncbi:hypothetical protein [Pseudochrobactrum kiredjianiae]|uniref:Alanine and proline-rich secreted protein Apa n=1 Tax=Pseudochrobactrum kiredjianiae TaxID=386305 RepID=A0ABW3V985_9HYPH|nr:hypothetical protein [Pseudochrobactrum kiredjianiae]MDM7850555.1 hypothetical protein [Pseudochrobactrum kiredjianiae]
MLLSFRRRLSKLSSDTILSKSFLTGLAFAMIAASASVPASAGSLNKSPQILALSETPAGDEEEVNPAQVPLPGPLRQVPTETYRAPGAEPPAANGAAERDITRPQVSTNGKIPEVSYDYSKLPQAVQDTRKKILDIAKAGKIDALKPLLGDGGETSPLLSLGEYDGTPLEFLKSLSGDSNGQELLAILVDLLESGYAHLDAGTPSEVYVWPYFFAYPLDKLDDRQMVELYQLITAGDYEEMKGVGAYIFYRLGITPDGSWKFFVAGD